MRTCVHAHSSHAPHCSYVCVCAGRKCAETAVVPCEKAAKARIDDIHRLMPGLASLTLRISGRRNPTTNFHGLGVLEHLEVLASLRTLVLHFTTPPDSVTITGSGKPPLGGLCDLAVGAPRLQELVVRGRTLTAMDLSALAQLPELATLILEGEPPGGTVRGLRFGWGGVGVGGRHCTAGRGNLERARGRRVGCFGLPCLRSMSHVPMHQAGV